MKDALDTRLILEKGFFRCFHNTNLGLHNDGQYINQTNFKELTLDHQEITEIRTALKLKKETV